MKSRRYSIILHVLGSAAFLSIPVLISPDTAMGMQMFSVPFLQRDLIYYTFLLLFFHFNYYWLIEKLLLPKKYLHYLIVIILLFLLFFYVSRLPIFLNHNWIHPHKSLLRMQNIHPWRVLVLREWLFFTFPYLTVLTFSIIMKYAGLWKKAEKERTEAELVYLKHQINPHFLFNTLNSIYSLSLQKSEETSKAILKLSGMMRYFFEQGEQMKVPLEKEIQYIRDYIELQKIRLGNTTNIELTIDGDISRKNIASFVLLTFIENAFKYGVNPELESKISISIKILGSQLYFSCINNLANNGNTIHESKGLGIANTKKRLQFLYPGKHILKINSIENNFIVELSISLDD